MKEDLAISKNGLMSLFEENNRLKRELDLAQSGSGPLSKTSDEVSSELKLGQNECTLIHGFYFYIFCCC